jgi:RNA:NAD 2'-phosphotransferase (TPT1/KptA family)
VSWVLRHGAMESGIEIDTAGFVKLSDLLRFKQISGWGVVDIHKVR